jgi:hypothetical protein
VIESSLPFLLLATGLTSRDVRYSTAYEAEADVPNENAFRWNI